MGLSPGTAGVSGIAASFGKACSGNGLTAAGFAAGVVSRGLSVALSVGVDLDCPNPPAETLNVTKVNNDNYIQVRVTYKFSPVTPVIGFFLDLDQNNQITVGTQSRMRIEG